MTTPEARLAAFVADLGPEGIPPPVLERVRQHVLDAIACGLAGHLAEGRVEMEGVAAAVFGAGRSTVLAGRPRAPGGAVLLNGFKIAAPTLGDVHRETLTHVLPEVLPASLAAAEVHDATGADLLAGVAAGMEVAVRVARALDTDAYRARAWHNPGIAGAIGAACAASRVAGLDAHAVQMAIGHAASQAAGTFAALGTSGVKVHQARGGLSGFLAAEFAAAGLDAADAALTASRGGLLASYADGGRPNRLTDRLGDVFELESVALRRWPGASSLQPVIEAALALRRQLGLAPGTAGGLAAIAEVRVDLPSRAYALNGTSGWETRLAALQSARWTTAVALEDGDVWLDSTADDRRHDPLVVAFASERVTVAEDQALSLTGARVVLRPRGGPELTFEVDVPAGDPRRPLSAADIGEKLERAATAVGLGDRVPSMLATIGSLETAGSPRELLAAVGQ